GPGRDAVPPLAPFWPRSQFQVIVGRFSPARALSANNRHAGRAPSRWPGRRRGQVRSYDAARQTVHAIV
ncbi:hypothetical protein LN572_12140, partial [Xanthomonas citri pv. fuscans]|uniref:hypothetical protein n=1 Tax=Xanthomonas citri TaxID=346 RepID=UPI001E3919A0